MHRSTAARILIALLASWVQWTFADPTGARSQAMYGVAPTASAIPEACHGPAAAHGAHDVVPHATDADDDAPDPAAHHHGCALCPLACCAGVVLPGTAAPTATTVALVAHAAVAPWPPRVQATAGAPHRLPFATGPPIAG